MLTRCLLRRRHALDAADAAPYYYAADAATPCQPSSAAACAYQHTPPRAMLPRFCRRCHGVVAPKTLRHAPLMPLRFAAIFDAMRAATIFAAATVMLIC